MNYRYTRAGWCVLEFIQEYGFIKHYISIFPPLIKYHYKRNRTILQLIIKLKE